MVGRNVHYCTRTLLYCTVLARRIRLIQVDMKFTMKIKNQLETSFIIGSASNARKSDYCRGLSKSFLTFHVRSVARVCKDFGAAPSGGMLSEHNFLIKKNTSTFLSCKR